MSDATNGSADISDRRRRLVALLHADIVGYTRHMARNEHETWRRAIAVRTTASESASRHDGRVVGTAGDAILIEFPSVVGALDAALEIQEFNKAENRGVDADNCIHLRIGINLGDVIDDGGDLFGDGVNVAERVQGLADPGGIAVSASIFEQARTHARFHFTNRGSHRVKNVADPVRVFTLHNGKGSSLPRRARGAGVLALALLVLAIGGGALWIAGVIPIPSLETSGVVSGKPTLAVLPFEDRSSGENDRWFADGMTEDVIAELGRFSNLHVLSWSAVAPYRAAIVSPEALHQKLQVRYVVSGSLVRSAERLELRIQLTDARLGRLLWSDRISESLEDIFAVQDEVARQIVGNLAVQVTDIERSRAFEKPTENLDAYDQVLRGREHMRRVTRPDNFEARRLFRKAVELDPDYAAARLGLAWTHVYDFMFGWSERRDRSLDVGRELAEEAVTLDPQNADAHALLAYLLRFSGELEDARRHIEIALDLNPNDPQSLATHAHLEMLSGNVEAATEPAELVFRLDPNPRPFWLFTLGEIYYLLGRYDDAIALLERHATRFNEDPAPRAVLAAAHAEAGNVEKARDSTEALKRMSPFFDSESFAEFFTGTERDRGHLLEGLKRAGL